jgi:hypothetical protein
VVATPDVVLYYYLPGAGGGGGASAGFSGAGFSGAGAGAGAGASAGFSAGFIGSSAFLQPIVVNTTISIIESKRAKTFFIGLSPPSLLG